ncbi:hypothetical protein [Homoserinimonas sp. OAct 916]|uniref:hypothetical protein n=1 Tax=Homoserinimonas sp. OAct 916 TaxID=2211450 RepID=UPI000DBE642E|nr:hypothetical protein [Homoserinimonas sp. OAct 916]
MKNFVWLIVGVGVGFIAAHQLNKTRVGSDLFARIDAQAKEFSDAVGEGYRTREAELRRAIGDA